MVSASMLCRLQKPGEKCAADIGGNAEVISIYRKPNCFLIFRFGCKLNPDNGILRP